MGDQIYKCPLCGSILVRDHWVKITGQWEAEQKRAEDIKKKLEQFKKEKLLLEKKHQLDLKKAQKAAEIIGIQKGVKKEKSERERMSKLLQNQAKTMIESNKRILELEKQLKEGKTPQTAGFDYEKEVAKMLSENFPDDEIKSTGKLGDNIQIVRHKDQEAGSILYECKKTSKYDNSFVLEAKRHQETAGCNYAVVVTHAVKSGKSRFFIDGEVIVIDPLGLLDLAFLLRSSIIEMHLLKLTKEEMNEKSKEILRYMQTGVFKNRMSLAMQKSEDAYYLLIEEMRGHKKLWQQRYEIYSTIHTNVQMVRLEIGKIITGNPRLIEDVKQLPQPLL
ncbi:hypothetical protein A2697_01520 [Candidatus Curtissbacteria bacterium RIFCSPHIGHO2_01_FULL_41_44]|uniref:DUF2130 domain-containing protein n=1 Tax=Candidatus Curtissbacteria bacterium RIFCSPLOWO2_01_FULL_42_50 TaxID=1797730 RepID=A0A1F5H684_9BACT|nr:MAG: hypothetical protein A2697_01520 [Candidatus Curtissbacteria bacterium RIFCSPHIGHO2_01_FULL_41_44]OGD99611.1 MAG: hypothetical protein A3B54_02900 [Candidatus Curtissbacteria bacterium RIFCSPLOWO2_01_FULL_42_50]